MTEIVPSKYIIGFIMFTFFIVGGIALISEFNKTSSSWIDDTRYSTFNSTFNKYTDVQNEADNLKDSVTSGSTDWGIFGVLNALINVGWNTIVTIFDSFSFITDAITGLSSFFGVPNWAVSLVASLIIVMIVFSILAAIFQRKI